MRFFKSIAVLFIFLLTACQMSQITQREKGALAGGALGAGLGAVVGNQVGNSGAGIAIGSAVGAISGGLIGNSLENDSKRMDDRQKVIDQQRSQLDENNRMLEELRSKGADARITDRGIVVNLPDVLFEFNSAKLSSNAQSTVNSIAEASRTNNRLIAVEGHTDSIGSSSYNMRLSLDRAYTVADAINAKGVKKQKIAVRGFGETKPVASNSNARDRQRNRRVEVIFEN